jgi:hypothetical protein
MGDDCSVPEEAPIGGGGERVAVGCFDGVAEFEERIFLAGGADDGRNADTDRGSMEVVRTKTCKFEKLYQGVQMAG